MTSEYNWGELVDSYVDNECSEEERRLLEAQTAKDEKIRESLEIALRIRSGLSAMKATLPSGFDERLQQALAGARLPNESRANRSWGSGFGRKNIRIIAGLAASIAVALGLGSLYDVREGEIEPVESQPIAYEGTSLQGEDLDDAPGQNTFIRIPSPAGSVPESISKRDLGSALWVVVEPNDPVVIKKQRSEFQRLCNRLGIRFTKSGDDAELLLRGIDVQDWKQVDGALAEFGGTTLSDALRTWSCGDSNESCDVRVVFRNKDDRGPVGKDISVGE